MERINKKCSNLLLFGLLSLFLCLVIFSQNTKVYASIPTMTIDDASFILEHFRSGDNYKFKYISSTSDATEYSNLNLLTTKANSADLMNIWNNNIIPLFNTNSASGDNWNDIIFTFFGYTTTDARIRILFLGDSTSSGFGKAEFDCGNYTTNQYYYSIKPTSGSPCGYRVDIKITSNGMVAPTSTNWFYTSANGTLLQRINNNLDPINTNNNDLSCDFAYTLGQDTKTYYNNGTTEYTLINRPVLTPSEPIEGDTTSSLGYEFYERNNVPAIPINILGSTSKIDLDEYWYVGDDLDLHYNYYYYSGDSKISINNKVYIRQTRNVEDNGTYYEPSLLHLDYQDFPNNTGFYLDIYVTLNNQDYILRNDFYSFYTYSEVVDSGQTGTITITNSSGDTSSGEVDLTGIQSGINNVNNTLTNVPNISGTTISSGDIYNSLGFQIASDPYANFWYEFTQSLGQALTTSTKSYIDINYLGYVYRWDLTNMHNPLPGDLRNFLTAITTCFMVYYLVKQVRILINDLQSGGIMSTAHGAVVGDDTFIAYF